jgi:hypothetical protein
LVAVRDIVGSVVEGEDAKLFVVMVGPSINVYHRRIPAIRPSFAVAG